MFCVMFWRKPRQEGTKSFNNPALDGTLVHRRVPPAFCQVVPATVHWCPFIHLGGEKYWKLSIFSPRSQHESFGPERSMRSPALPNNKLGGYLSIFWNPKTSHSASKIMTKGSSWSLLINNYFIHKSRINESTTNTTHKVNLRKPVCSNKDLQLYFQLLQL